MCIRDRDRKNIGEVEVKDNQIIFTDKDQKNIYKTGMMNDPNLTDRLYECGAVFANDIDKPVSYTHLIAAIRERIIRAASNLAGYRRTADAFGRKGRPDTATYRLSLIHI